MTLTIEVKGAPAMTGRGWHQRLITGHKQAFNALNTLFFFPSGIVPAEGGTRSTFRLQRKCTCHARHTHVHAPGPYFSRLGREP